MFYEGTLQEGISSAVGQQKLVLCFVTGKSPTTPIPSSPEITRLLTRPLQLRRLIQNQAVALRLIAGSEEAGYLAQIFPLPQTPTIVIMKHGELKEYISAGTSKEDFFRRLQSAFNVSPSAAAAPSSSSSSSLANGLAAFVPIRRSPSPHAATAAQTTTSPLPVPDDGRSEAVNRVLAERVARLKAEKEEAECKAKEERAKAAERARAADPSKAKQAEEAKRRKKQQDDERKRILRNIDADKEERRLRASAREKQRIDSQQVGDVASALTSAPRTALPSTTRATEIASLQVRLFDGSTIRSRFQTAMTLLDVRQWVDENKGANKLPYTFKQVLTPLPNKNIDETEERKTLGELGLMPSSTLVLIPTQRHSSAYDRGSSGGFGFFGFFALILSFFSWLAGLFHIFTGRGSRQEDSGPRQPDNEATASARDVNHQARDLRNRADRRRDQQLYNGNSLNFEPRPLEDDD
ncbi:UBX domain-containing protein 7 [Escovopsis weberi]|uniref:UBX domain-containing protein 7 n=1 Tax=Escovopsis weberi TaxID=150374 RepID=A0A0M9VWD0_ESCWE|nr:UBX domain-containing protein 7 [Escovopsis weberi]